MVELGFKVLCEVYTIIFTFRSFLVNILIKLLLLCHVHKYFYCSQFPARRVASKERIGLWVTNRVSKVPDYIQWHLNSILRLVELRLRLFSKSRLFVTFQALSLYSKLIYSAAS